MRLNKVPFGEFAHVQPSVPLERGAPYAFIAMEDVEPRRRSVAPGSERIWDGGGGARFENGDVLFARITPCLEHGKTSQVENLPGGAGFGSTEFFVFRERPGISDSRYIYYLSCSDALREPAIKSMIGASGRQRAQRIVVEETLVPAPPLLVQRKIADVLSGYDDLIENNRRRMALLEDAARQLYGEWFVHLRFPGHEHTRITNGVPRGWTAKTLGDLCREVRETVHPKALDPDTPYIGLEHMPRRAISLSDWGTAEQVSSSKHRFREGEILFGKIRPYFHKVGIAFVDGVASSDAIVIRPLEQTLRGFVLLTVSSDPFVAVTAQTMKEGSKMPRADWKQMQAYPTPLPPAGLLGSFENAIQPILEQLKTLTFANQKLRAARDLLLPRLMSGQVAV